MYRVRRPQTYPQAVIDTARRFLKTLTVREYKPLGNPIEFIQYQRFTNHPNRQSGVQFLTHYNTHRRWDVKKDYIDYLRWGREQGQAHLPHRHHRVAFDFNDSLHPTVIPAHAQRQNGWFEGQDPSQGPHPDLSTTFNPNKKLFSHPAHFNRLFTTHRPGEGDIRLQELESNNLLWHVAEYSQTVPKEYFGMTNLTEQANAHGVIPGIHTPYLGETDRMMMQAMANPLTEDNTIAGNDGRFSKTIYLNNSARGQVLEGSMTKNLQKIVDESCNAVYSKLVVLKSAQSGETDYFCNTADWDRVSLHMRLAQELRGKADVLMKAATGSSHRSAREAQILLYDVRRHESLIDELLRDQLVLLWRVFSAPRSLMTFVNGKARGTGCGLALLAKFPALRDSTELIFDGPDQGLTPFGGLTNFLARQETSLKFPGLAEFVMLTGTALYAGDALRLGWTDLFTTLADMDYHIKQWFDNSEHMHNDAVAWQLGQLLDTCFRMKECHNTALERAAISKQRAMWIEDAFADQPSVDAILATLSQMEKISYADSSNTRDVNGSTPFSLSVQEGLDVLNRKRLKFELDPWDVAPLSAEDSDVAPPADQHITDVFLSYYLENRNGTDIVVNKYRDALRRWRKQRYQEYKQFKAMREMPMPRRVFARLEGCEGKVVDFDFVFDRSAAVDAMKLAASGKGELTQDDTFCAMISTLKAAISNELFGSCDRDIEVGWCLPTFETCKILSDDELQKILFADPGVEDSRNLTKYPPLYLIVKRSELYMSEWAYAVKHKILLQSPFAVKASFQMLRRIRGDGSESSVQSIGDSLATEFRYARRLVKRPDFYQIGTFANLPFTEWERLEQDRALNIHSDVLPARPRPSFEEVFERDVVLDGHKFSLRPRWSPRSLHEVKEPEITALDTDLDFEADGATEIDVPTCSAKTDFIDGMVDDIGGLELVPRLGESDASTGKPVVPPLASNASVPKDVDFYRMARHPWTDVETSWRYNGFTDISQELFERKYKQAEKDLVDPEGRGVASYWAPKETTGGSGSDKDEALLKDRLFNVLRSAENSVENWARELRSKAQNQESLAYKLETASLAEKVYDDEYYRWFIIPGAHPNPSGIVKGGAAAAQGASKMDRDIEALMQALSTPVDAEDVSATASLEVTDFDAIPGQDLAAAAGDDEPVEG